MLWGWGLKFQRAFGGTQRTKLWEAGPPEDESRSEEVRVTEEPPGALQGPLSVMALLFVIN